MDSAQTKHAILDRAGVDVAELLTSRRFGSKLVHDLRNPVAAIEALIQSMEEEAREAGLHDLLELIGFEATRLGRMLDRLALLLRRRPPRFKETPLAAFVEAVADRGRRTIDGAEIVVERCDGCRSAVRIDPEQLEVVLLELLRNGVEAYAGGAGKVWLSVAREPSRVTFTVRDDGNGMDAAAVQKAVEPFFTDKAQASGLGLPIAMVLVHAQGGSIDAESAVGSGTTVTVSIPLAEQAGE